MRERDSIADSALLAYPPSPSLQPAQHIKFGIIRARAS